MGNARNFEAFALQMLGDVQNGRITFKICIQSEDDFFDLGAEALDAILDFVKELLDF